MISMAKKKPVKKSAKKAPAKKRAASKRRPPGSLNPPRGFALQGDADWAYPAALTGDEDWSFPGGKSGEDEAVAPVQGGFGNDRTPKQPKS